MRPGNSAAILLAQLYPLLGREYQASQSLSGLLPDAPEGFLADPLFTEEFLPWLLAEHASSATNYRRSVLRTAMIRERPEIQLAIGEGQARGRTSATQRSIGWSGRSWTTMRATRTPCGGPCWRQWSAGGREALITSRRSCCSPTRCWPRRSPPSAAAHCRHSPEVTDETRPDPGRRRDGTHPARLRQPPRLPRLRPGSDRNPDRRLRRNRLLQAGRLPNLRDRLGNPMARPLARRPRPDRGRQHIRATRAGRRARPRRSRPPGDRRRTRRIPCQERLPGRRPRGLRPLPARHRADRTPRFCPARPGRPVHAPRPRPSARRRPAGTAVGRVRGPDRRGPRRGAVLAPDPRRRACLDPAALPRGPGPRPVLSPDR